MFGAAVINNYHMHLLPCTGLVKMAGVSGYWLARSAAGQQAQKHTEVFGPGNNFFDAHACNVHCRCMYAHIRIAFVGANHKASRFSNGKIYARYCQLRLYKFIP